MHAGNNALLPSGLTPQELDDHVIGAATIAGQERGTQWETFDFSQRDLELDAEHHDIMWLRMHPPYPADNGRGLRSSLAGVPGLPVPYPRGRQFLCLPDGGECQVDPMSFDSVFRVRVTPGPPPCEAR